MSAACVTLRPLDLFQSRTQWARFYSSSWFRLWHVVHFKDKQHKEQVSFFLWSALKRIKKLFVKLLIWALHVRLPPSRTFQNRPEPSRRPWVCNIQRLLFTLHWNRYIFLRSRQLVQTKRRNLIKKKSFSGSDWICGSVQEEEEG